MADKKEKVTKLPVSYVVTTSKENVMITGPKGKYPLLGKCKKAELKEIHELQLTTYVTKLG